jgi:aminotransferase in exopolysaccharide biosynthesis
MFDEIVSFIKKLYNNKEIVPLHAPVFLGKEKEYLSRCIDTTFVSYVGEYVNQFEDMTASFTGAKYAVAIVNGTAALQVALTVADVKACDEVITQPFTFVATANAISHCGAKPVFIDVDSDTLGMSAVKLEYWLNNNAYIKDDKTYNKITKRKISAIVPVHTFGFPCKIDKIIEIADKYRIPVIEDSAEAIGSFFNGKHCGTFGLAGILSYNGNKTITTGGGGMIITDDENFSRKVKHLTTTAKIPHKYEYIHDEIGYNYRMPNINAAIGVAQMENLSMILNNKRETAMQYKDFFKKTGIKFMEEPLNSEANYWLNAILFDNKETRNSFLEYTNNNGVQTRPAWKILNELEMYKECQTDDLTNSKRFSEGIVNIPSGVRV